MNNRPDLGILAAAPVGLLLIAAALLKTYQLAVSPADANYIFDSRGLTILLIEVELFLGFWLLSGIRRFEARVVCLLLFTVFLVASFAKAIAGETSCGCLGVIQVHPWFMFSVDLLAIGLLIFALKGRAVEKPVSGSSENSVASENPGSSKISDPPGISGLARASIIAGACLMAGVLIPVFSLKTTTISDTGDIPADGLVIIEPGDWIGKPLPLRTFIDQSEEILTGQWKVILYHEDCPVCQEHIQAALANPSGEATAFVEVPPLQSPRRQSRSNLLWLKLTSTRDWFVEAPSTMILQDGIVKQFIPRDESH